MAMTLRLEPDDEMALALLAEAQGTRKQPHGSLSGIDRSLRRPRAPYDSHIPEGRQPRGWPWEGLEADPSPAVLGWSYASVTCRATHTWFLLQTGSLVSTPASS